MSAFEREVFVAALEGVGLAALWMACAVALAWLWGRL